MPGMSKQTTYFLLRIDHPENVDVDGLRARMEGGQNVISLQVLGHPTRSQLMMPTNLLTLPLIMSIHCIISEADWTADC